MPKKGHSEEQIVAVLRQVEARARVEVKAIVALAGFRARSQGAAHEDTSVRRKE